MSMNNQINHYGFVKFDLSVICLCPISQDWWFNLYQLPLVAYLPFVITVIYITTVADTSVTVLRSAYAGQQEMTF